MWLFHSKMTERVEQWFCIKCCIKLEHSFTNTVWMMQKAVAMGNWWLAASSQQHATHSSHSVQSFLTKHQITQVTQPAYIPDLVPCDFWLFPKLKSPLKWKRFQTMKEIQENMAVQLRVTGRTAWGPKVPTLKRTETSLSYVQCFLYLVSSSMHVSIFHIILCTGSFKYTYQFPPPE